MNSAKDNQKGNHCQKESQSTCNISAKNTKKIHVQCFLKPKFAIGRLEPLAKLLLKPPEHHVRKILQIRQLSADNYKKAKRTLPLFNAGAIFSPGKRVLQNVTDYTNLLSIDIDNVKDTKKVKELLSNLKYCFYAGESVSGSGIFFLLRYTSHKSHYEHFYYVLNDLKKLGFPLSKERGGGDLGHIDATCSDLLRDRFISFDPNPYINAKATTLEGKYTPYKPSGYGLQVTVNGGLWVKRALGYVSSKGVSFADGQKHRFILLFATAANLLGVPESECKQYIYNNYLPEEKIDSKPFNAYKERQNLFGLWKEGNL